MVNPWILGKNKAAAYVENTSKEKVDYSAQYGLREVSLVNNRLLHLHCGPGIDLRKLTQTGLISISNTQGQEIGISNINRRSKLDFYRPAGWPWRWYQNHDLYLHLNDSLQEGKTYKISFNDLLPLTCGRNEISFTYKQKESINYSIKLNQYGYLTKSKKYAYVGLWMGDGNATDFSPDMESYSVRDATSHKIVFQGKPTLRRKATYTLVNGRLSPDPQQTKGPETIYKNDLSYESVYQLDLSEFKESGQYYINIPGMGRSFTFEIGNSVYSEAFKIVMNGIYHQRCGIELKAPYSQVYRPACHRNSTIHTRIDSKKRPPHKEWHKYAIDNKKHDLYGGHHDAGDWEPRSHLDVAESLLLAYEMNPKAFFDGQLNIPENNNSIPDILDEAFWAFDLWQRLQDEDGGVYYGTETPGDPLSGDRAHFDSLTNYTFAKSSEASFYFAAVAAQMSRTWNELGRTKEAAEFLVRSKRAYLWAHSHRSKNNYQKQKTNDYHAYAAACLLRATGEGQYSKDFLANCDITQNPNKPPVVHGKYDQQYAMYHYAKAKKGHKAVQRFIRKSFDNMFIFWMRWAKTTTYRYMRSPYAPNTWGTGGFPVWNVFPALCMDITQNQAIHQSCKDWVGFNNDFSLGCHPLGVSFTVGLGQRYVKTAFHHLQGNSPEPMISGLQSEGAGGKFLAGPRQSKGGMASWPGLSMYPYGQWPDLYKYAENAAPSMNEGVVKNQAR
ncbi:MAG: glycoside hydrolase family 9 protein, partial [Lentisphaeraceae bacterium]|nr:glycoside hydrolase family 9 protein [Lentisphaeraceae bacterium]